jgi:bacteriorhodopsin
MGWVWFICGAVAGFYGCLAVVAWFMNEAERRDKGKEPISSVQAAAREAYLWLCRWEKEEGD